MSEMVGTAVGPTSALYKWAERFALIGDLNRLRLLMVIRNRGPICVSDLVQATGLKTPTMSRALRLLRAFGLVAAHRDGRSRRYELTDDREHALLEHLVEPTPVLP